MNMLSSRQIFPVRQIISGNGNIGERVCSIHTYIKDVIGCSGISRVSLAVYDKESDLVSTFAFSDDNDEKFSLYSARLQDVKSLFDMSTTGQFRVVDSIFENYSSDTRHSSIINKIGLCSSVTFPVSTNIDLTGFVFFNSTSPSYFTENIISAISPYAALLGLMLMNEVAPLNAVKAAVDTVRDVASLRDDETGAHLLRMSAYVRLIASELAKRYKYPDEWVDMLTRCAPLHDIGKISVPDHILHKPGKLSSEERVIMQQHVNAGAEIGMRILDNFGLDKDHIKTMLKQVICEHHETIDGLGYPNGLNDDIISVEARIVAIADIFDALTTERSYKDAWTIDGAIEYIKELSGVKLDKECVDIFADNIDEILLIRARFPDADV
jgi:HD-GYP domain-containing protein (c-di-GMP phosphodiesterase class II)